MITSLRMPVRRALLAPLLLVSGCTIVPVTNPGPCSGVSNWRGCQEKPYVVRWHADDGAGQQAQTTR